MINNKWYLKRHEVKNCQNQNQIRPRQRTSQFIPESPEKELKKFIEQAAAFKHLKQIMETEDLTGGDSKETRVQFKNCMNGRKDTDTDTVNLKKLPVKEFAKLISSPKKETVVGKFEGFFHW